MSLRKTVLSTLAAGAAVLALAACSDSTAGTGTAAAGGSGSGGGSSAASSAPSSSAPASDAAGLAAKLATATAKGTSVHMSISSEGAGAGFAGEGDIRTADGGKTEAFSFQYGTGAQAVSMVYVDGTGYVKLPAGEATDPSKPWAQVSATSANPVVKALAASFDQIQSQSSITQYVEFVKASDDFTVVGPTTIGGAQGTGYSMTLDPSKLPPDSSLGSAAAAGLGKIPMTIVVDDAGHPLQVVDSGTVSGQSFKVTVTMSDYGKTVDIEAPPADQTTTG